MTETTFTYDSLIYFQGQAGTVLLRDLIQVERQVFLNNKPFIVGSSDFTLSMDLGQSLYAIFPTFYDTELFYTTDDMHIITTVVDYTWTYPDDLLPNVYETFSVLPSVYAIRSVPIEEPGTYYLNITV